MSSPITAPRLGATWSIAVQARLMSGMVAGSMRSPWAAHSPATASASPALGSTSAALAGVRMSRPSSCTP